MRPFHSRPNGYKAGLVLLFLATIIYLAGFSAPYWAGGKSSMWSLHGGLSLSIHRGLWTVCVGVEIPLAADTTTCTAHSMDGVPSTFHAARALSCVCLIALLVCCIYAILINCTNSAPSSAYPLLEVGSTLAGLLGFFGCLVFAAYQAGSGSVSSPGLSGAQPGKGFLPSGNGGLFGNGFYSKPGKFYLTTTPGVFPGNGFPSFPGNSGSPTSSSDSSLTLGWAFYLAVAGCSLTVIAAVIISLANKPVASQSEEAPVDIPMTTTCFGQGQASWAYQNHGQAPPANHTQGQGQYCNPGQGHHPAQGHGYAVVNGQSQGQGNAATNSQGRGQGQGQPEASGHGQGQGQGYVTGEPQSLGPIKIIGAPPDDKPPGDSKDVLTLQDPGGSDDSEAEDSLS